jgi:hypothetical protein
LYGSIILLSVVMLQASAVEPQLAAAAPWEHVHRWVEKQRDRMAEDLETAHAALLARARAAGEDALVERLRAEPPQPRPHGYGILPEILDDPPPQPVVTRRNTYSLESLSTTRTRDFRDAALLASRVASEPDLPLAPWVSEFERLRERMQNLEDHLDYHAKWQVEVVAHKAWFFRNNRIIDKLRDVTALQEQNAQAARIDAARDEALRRLTLFRPTPGLHLETRDDGMRVLTVEVWTDVDDETFLDTAPAPWRRPSPAPRRPAPDASRSSCVGAAYRPTRCTPGDRRRAEARSIRTTTSAASRKERSCSRPELPAHTLGRGAACGSGPARWPAGPWPTSSVTCSASTTPTCEATRAIRAEPSAWCSSSGWDCATT